MPDMEFLTRTHLLIVVAVFCHLMTTSHGWLMSSFVRRRSCYTSPRVGCFNTSYPHDNTGGLAPEAPDDVDVTFKISRRGLQAQTFNVENAQQVLSNAFTPDQKTVVLIHGYLDSCESLWIERMTSELLQKEPTNVLCVDWNEGAGHFIYLQSAANARMAGALLALVLQDLVSLGGDASNFHLIGWSLGAHVAGFAGKRMAGLGRITGLDPASVAFDGTPSAARLHSGDALYVDVLHTDANPPLGLGAVQPMGDVDYYVNGGNNQPGCFSALLNSISLSSGRAFLNSITYRALCNHYRAVALFKSTIRGTCSFLTYRCPGPDRVSVNKCQLCDVRSTCPNLGFNLATNETVSAIRGFYRIDTTGAHPFC